MMTRRAVLLTALALAGSAAALAQTGTVQNRSELINWYYAATFGTGFYTAGDRTVAVVQAPISYGLKPPAEGEWGVKLLLPISLGFYNYNLGTVVDRGLPSRLNTVSAVPGVEFERIVSPRLDLRPYVSAGWGKDLSGSDSAFIYDVGIRGRYLLGENRGVTYALLGRLSEAGYRPQGGSTQPLGFIATGIDITVPTGQELADHPISIGFTPSYWYYFRQLKFAQFSAPENRITEQWEFALSLITSKPWNILGFDLDRIGLAVQTGGGVTGVHLFTSQMF
ncbi:MAG TPA: hypothetical protein VFB20_02835 [Burkholderiales bacterium]|nr:hypothetical protein [Burkholderiales bacterium]